MSVSLTRLGMLKNFEHRLFAALIAARNACENEERGVDTAAYLEEARQQINQAQAFSLEIYEWVETYSNRPTQKTRCDR